MSEQSSEWFILNEQNEQEGPISEPALRKLRSIGRIGPDTRVWSQKLTDWSTYESEFPSLRTPKTVRIIPETPRVETAGPSLPKSGAVSRFFGGVHRPWRRWFARFVDLNLFGNTVGIIVLIVLQALTPTIASQFERYIADPIVDGAILLLLWMPFECACISLFGSTPAKWLFGIRISDLDGKRLNFIDSLRRYVGMMVQGAGIGIPVVVFFTYIFSYRRLTSTGTTAWDEASHSEVSHVSFKSWRYAATTLAVIGSLLFTVLLKTQSKTPTVLANDRTAHSIESSNEAENTSEEVKESELLRPPPWAEVEADPKFQNSSDAKKILVIAKWRRLIKRFNSAAALSNNRLLAAVDRLPDSESERRFNKEFIELIDSDDLGDPSAELYISHLQPITPRGIYAQFAIMSSMFASKVLRQQIALLEKTMPRVGGEYSFEAARPRSGNTCVIYLRDFFRVDSPDKMKKWEREFVERSKSLQRGVPDESLRSMDVTTHYEIFDIDGRYLTTYVVPPEMAKIAKERDKKESMRIREEYNESNRLSEEKRAARIAMMEKIEHEQEKREEAEDARKELAERKVAAERQIQAIKDQGEKIAEEYRASASEQNAIAEKQSRELKEQNEASLSAYQDQTKVLERTKRELEEIKKESGVQSDLLREQGKTIDSINFRQSQDSDRNNP